MSLIPVILCGGAGSRLWPVSREQHPKPFIRLADGESLFQKAYLRACGLPDVSKVIVVANGDFAHLIEGEIAGLGIPRPSTVFVYEPVGRNTAPAAAVAALLAAREDPDARLILLAADHLISDQGAFRDAVERALGLAAGGSLVTFGITPTAPETGYGYIEARGTQVLKFVEKPDVETAKAYILTGRYYWNSGMVCSTARALLSEMQQHCPDILSAVHACLERSPRAETATGAACTLDTAAFSAVPKNSLDYAVMEKSSRVAVVPCDIGWSDVGCWNMLGTLFSPDAQGNRIKGEAVLHRVVDCNIWSSGRVIGMVGVSGLVVVDTPDALLVAAKDCVQDVRHVFGELKQSGHAAHASHATATHAWGTTAVLSSDGALRVERITLKPGARIELAVAQGEACHVTVGGGYGVLASGGVRRSLAAGSTAAVASGAVNVLQNTGNGEFVMIKVVSAAPQDAELHGHATRRVS